MKVLFGPNMMGLEQAIPALSQQFPTVEFAHCGARQELPQSIADADVYVGWLDRDVFLAARRLAWIQSPSSGCDHFLAIPELAGGDVLLTSARGTHGACVAESAMAMILALTRGIKDSVLRQQERAWAPREIRPKMVELTGSTLGIIGFGAEGRALARRASAFDMRVIAVDLYPGEKPDSVSELWGLERLRDLLRESDYVVVTAPRTPQTRGLIGAAQLALMRPGAVRDHRPGGPGPGPARQAPGGRGPRRLCARAPASRARALGRRELAHHAAHRGRHPVRVPARPGDIQREPGPLPARRAAPAQPGRQTAWFLRETALIVPAPVLALCTAGQRSMVAGLTAGAIKGAG